MKVKKQRWKSTNKKMHLVTYSNPDSVISDGFRTIRSNINFLTEQNQGRIFMITSPDKGEGKSTITANLAVSMAQQKKRVLLIDANLRHPVIHDIFKLSNAVGLTDVLTEGAELDNALQCSPIRHLEILTSGTFPTNPAETLGNARMLDLLQTIAPMYDAVLIDSPPVLTSTETRVLANLSDGVLLVINRSRTKMEKTIESSRVLELAKAKLIGAIINEK